METPQKVSRRAWQDGEARCPSCGLYLDPKKDVNEEIYYGTGRLGLSEVRGTHRRCGAPFYFELAD